LKESDAVPVVPSDETGPFQESPITAGHASMELVEKGILSSGAFTPART
jgi:hypothetical protein